jgi:hypothetical protein
MSRGRQIDSAVKYSRLYIYIYIYIYFHFAVLCYDFEQKREGTKQKQVHKIR